MNKEQKFEKEGSPKLQIEALELRCNQYYETIEQQALQLKALQDAVMALEPFDKYFFAVTDPVYQSIECYGCIGSRGNHREDCPVTKLREVLKEQGVNDE